MATISARNDATILKINRFLGLNENPDGDTAIKVGEMSEIKNFRITQDGHLQIRPGTKTVLSLADAWEDLTGQEADTENSAVRGAWRGWVNGKVHILAAWGGHVWDVDLENGAAYDRGVVEDEETTFFAFGDKVYLLDGTEYQSWDGDENGYFSEVTGYIPLVQTATTPLGSGTLLENVNRLTGLRRVLFSPDGVADTFVLPEAFDEVTLVTLEGEAVPVADYTVNTSTHSVTMDDAPDENVNTLEITYRVGVGSREDVTSMRFAEIYNGAQDTRVFLYGNGTNKCVYSGVPYDTGVPSADYFPDLYEAAVGDSSTPITALVRHYARLMVYKPDSTWSMQYTTVDLETGGSVAGFYVTPLNRQFGNEAEGQVKLLENNPLTLDRGSIYQWRSSGYSTYISSNENNAKRISDRVKMTLSGWDMRGVKTFNMKMTHEYWLVYGDTALILNYANDTWYYYDGLTFSRIIETEEGEQYGFGNDGRVVHFSRDYRNDDGEPLDCRAVTGAMDFSKDWLLKYSPMIFVAMQPESGARVYVTAESNRRSDYPNKLISYGLSTFLHADFNHWSFGTNRRPQTKRVKIKVKKATFYRLVFTSNSTSATATIIETDVKLRYGGQVK